MRVARRDGLDAQVIGDYAVWGVGSGIVVGHLVHLFLYHPEELAQPWRIFAVWEGLSSFGGLLGAVLAAVVYFRRKGIRIADYSDAFALAIAPGWGIARLGCFAIHDHPGVRTDFFLAVQFPGGARHDLGLYDALALFAIAAVVWALRARGLLAGRLLAVVALLYGIQRFLTDFLRATDVAYADARYLGLTPAQYFCFALWAYAAWQLLGRRRPSAVGTGPSRARAGAASR
jgi:phosphatidylglycerol:prolipoprotein diacylglycerol transferase